MQSMMKINVVLFALFMSTACGNLEDFELDEFSPDVERSGVMCLDCEFPPIDDPPYVPPPPVVSFTLEKTRCYPNNFNAGGCTVHDGRYGWSHHSSPNLAHSGSGTGTYTVGRLIFEWEATVAVGGDYNFMAPHFFLDGDFYVNDSDHADVDIAAEAFLTINGRVVDTVFIPINSSSYSGYFLFDRFYFSASRGDTIGLVIQLTGKAWAESGGFAAIDIDTYGIIANTVDDADITVRGTPDDGGGSGQTCTLPDDCLGIGAFCIDRRCYYGSVPCSTSSDCGTSAVCIDGTCWQA